ncbi:MAG TPA: glycosyl hydrolase family 18 protein [Myxococcales bacterium]|nr:glycosyl hydrolase family 18 protein [Myxococcales bacterium]
MVAPLLLAAFAAGPHARDAQLHALDADAPRVWSGTGTSAPVVNRRVYGYLPYWETIDLDNYRWDLITDVIAFSVNISSADGSISNTHALPGAALVGAAHAHGVNVHVGATLFNSSGGSEIATFLASSSMRAKAVSQLTALASGIEGLDLDFEFVPTASRDAFTSFVQQLHAAMQPGQELTLAMPANTSLGGYDDAALAASCERLLLMEYDYHYGGSNAGPQAPLTTGGFWNASITGGVDSFLALVAADKIAMGVPYYGLDWPTVSSAPGAAQSGSASTVLFKDAFAKFTAYGRLWDSPSQTPWYAYDAGGQEHEGWVDDGQSLALKYQLVNSQNLAGIMIWALGYDNGRTESWQAIQDAFVPAAAGELRILSVAYQLEENNFFSATLHVRNIGGQGIDPIAPPPDTVYEETQSSTGSIAGTWRLALDVADRPAAQQARPWRWGLPQSLAPGAEADVQVQVQLENSGTRTVFAAVIHEGVDVPQDNVFPTQVVIGSPDAGGSAAPDAGSGQPPPAVSQPRGCSHASFAAFWSLAALLGMRVRNRSWSRRGTSSAK